MISVKSIVYCLSGIMSTRQKDPSREWKIICQFLYIHIADESLKGKACACKLMVLVAVYHTKHAHHHQSYVGLGCHNVQSTALRVSAPGGDWVRSHDKTKY